MSHTSAVQSSVPLQERFPVQSTSQIPAAVQVSGPLQESSLTQPTLQSPLDAMQATGPRHD